MWDELDRLIPIGTGIRFIRLIDTQTWSTNGVIYHLNSVLLRLTISSEALDYVLRLSPTPSPSSALTRIQSATAPMSMRSYTLLVPMAQRHSSSWLPG